VYSTPGYVPQCYLYSLELNRAFGSWLVLGRTGGDFQEIRFADLGLPQDRGVSGIRILDQVLEGSIR